MKTPIKPVRLKKTSNLCHIEGIAAINYETKDKNGKNRLVKIYEEMVRIDL